MGTEDNSGQPTMGLVGQLQRLSIDEQPSSVVKAVGSPHSQRRHTLSSHHPSAVAAAAAAAALDSDRMSSVAERHSFAKEGDLRHSGEDEGIPHDHPTMERRRSQSHPAETTTGIDDADDSNVRSLPRRPTSAPKEKKIPTYVEKQLEEMAATQHLARIKQEGMLRKPAISRGNSDKTQEGNISIRKVNSRGQPEGDLSQWDTNSNSSTPALGQLTNSMDNWAPRSSASRSLPRVSGKESRVDEDINDAAPPPRTSSVPRPISRRNSDRRGSSMRADSTMSLRLRTTSDRRFSFVESMRYRKQHEQEINARRWWLGENGRPMVLMGWGSAATPYQMGLGTQSYAALPVEVPNSGPLASKHPKLAISHGMEHFAVLIDPGDVVMVGKGSHGQLGLGKGVDTAKEFEAIRFDGRMVEISQVSCGEYHTAVLSKEGDIYTFGRGANGALGLGTDHDQWVPKQVKNIRYVRMVACGAMHTLALAEIMGGRNGEAQVLSWGCGRFSALGHGDSLENCLEPRVVRALQGRRIVRLACGPYFSAAVSAKGNVYTWGSNDDGQLGHGDKMPRHIPMLVEQIKHPTEQVCCGGAHMLALVTPHDEGVVLSREVYSWGCNTSGQLGIGYPCASKPVPQHVEVLHGLEVNEMACGQEHSVVITRNSILLSFGAGGSSQLGVSRDPYNECYPKIVRTIVGMGIRNVCCAFQATFCLAAFGPNEKRMHKHDIQTLVDHHQATVERIEKKRLEAIQKQKDMRMNEIRKVMERKQESRKADMEFDKKDVQNQLNSWRRKRNRMAREKENREERIMTRMSALDDEAFRSIENGTFQQQSMDEQWTVVSQRDYPRHKKPTVFPSIPFAQSFRTEIRDELFDLHVPKDWGVPPKSARSIRPQPPPSQRSRKGRGYSTARESTTRGSTRASIRASTTRGSMRGPSTRGSIFTTEKSMVASVDDDAKFVVPQFHSGRDFDTYRPTSKRRPTRKPQPPPSETKSSEGCNTDETDAIRGEIAEQTEPTLAPEQPHSELVIGDVGRAEPRDSEDQSVQGNKDPEPNAPNAELQETGSAGTSVHYTDDNAQQSEGSIIGAENLPAGEAYSQANSIGTAD